MSNNSVPTKTNPLSVFFTPTVPFLVVTYILEVCAIILNSVEIKLITRKIKKATNFEIVLLNLAIADLVSTICFIAMTIITHYSYAVKEIRWNEGLYWLYGIIAFCIAASISFVAVIGIERFFAIKLPLQHRMWHTSRRKLVKYLIITWVFDIILIASAVTTDCLVNRKKGTILSTNLTYFFGGTMTLGVVLLLVLYTWVLHLMLLRSLKLFEFDKKVFRLNPKMMKKAMKKERSSIVICTLVVVSVLVCNIPIIVDFFQLRLTMKSALMMKITAVANPLIYFFKGYLEKYYANKRLISSMKDSDEAKANGMADQRSKDKTAKDQAANNENGEIQDVVENQNVAQDTKEVELNNANSGSKFKKCNENGEGQRVDKGQQKGHKGQEGDLQTTVM